MANFENASRETAEVFNQVMTNALLDNYIDYRLVVNNKLKEIGRATKNSDLNRFLSGQDLVITINEEVFEQLEVADQRIVAESIIAGVHYDTEKDRLNVNKGDIPAIHSGVVEKYGVDRYFNIQRLIKEVQSQLKDAKAEEGVEVE